MSRKVLRRGALAVSLASLTALALAACGSSSSSSGGAGGSKTLRVALSSLSQCNDPQLDNYGFGSSIGRQIVDSLVARDPSDANKIDPWLAKSWKVSPDAKTYTFHLRDGVTFSNGEKLTAQVVKDNFVTLAKYTEATGSAFVQGISSIDTPNASTVVIKFARPNAPFLQAAAQYQLGIVAEATLKESQDDRCANGVIGSGPYVTKSFTLNKNWVLKKRKGYNWASTAAKHQGEGYFQQIDFTFVQEASVRTGALKSGQVDLAPLTFQDVEGAKAAGLQTLSAPNRVPAVSLEVNTSKGVLQDEKVRQAFRDAIDRQDVVDKATSGLAKPATGSLTAASPFHLDQSGLLKYDPKTATSLLESAGWTQVKNGIRYKDGKPLKITVTYANDPANTQFLQVIQADVKKVGIDFELRALPTDAFDKALSTGDYEVHRWSGALIDGDVLRTLFSAKTLNKSQLPANNDLEPLFTAEQSTSDPAKRTKIIDKLQQLIVGRGYQIPIFDNVTYYGAAKDLQGVAFDDSAILLYDAKLG